MNTFGQCATCVGLGYFADAGTSECATCSGKGEIKESRSTFFGSFSQVRTCPKCSGTGQIPNKICRECRCSGRVISAKSVSIEIMPGIGDEQLIKVPKAGEVGERGAEAGDLYIRIKVLPHKSFERSGDDLVVKKEISLLDALSGTKIEIPTVNATFFISILITFSKITYY
jgi:molecular chaperone DnaJ